MTFDFPDDAQVHIVLRAAGSSLPLDLSSGAVLPFQPSAVRTRSGFRHLLTGIAAVVALLGAFELGGYASSPPSRSIPTAALAAARGRGLPSPLGPEALDDETLQEALDTPPAPMGPPAAQPQHDVPSAFRQQLAARPLVMPPPRPMAVPSGVATVGTAPPVPAASAAAAAIAPAGANPFGLHE